MAAAREWYESEDYAPLKALRRSASDTNIILVEGLWGEYLGRRGGDAQVGVAVPLLDRQRKGARPAGRERRPA